MNKIIFASQNKSKLEECRHVLAGLPFELISQDEYNVSDIEEMGLSFVENALIKARHASQQTGLPALGDDSGLMIDALNGGPGLYSARYAGKNTDYSHKINHLLTELSGFKGAERRARFVAVIVFLRDLHDPLPLICQGIWEGVILDAPRGEHGFGYDPVFGLTPEGESVAEMPPALKNTLSHRSQALHLFVEAYLSRLRSPLF